MTGNEEILAAMAQKDAEQASNPPVLRQIATGGASGNYACIYMSFNIK